MKFRSELAIRPFDFQVSHKDKMIFVGSCFSANIGEKLQALGYDVMLNPFGVLFNPLSMFENIRRAVCGSVVSEKEFVFSEERWNHWQFHGSMGRKNKNDLVQAINLVDEAVKQRLSEASVLFLTLGSAWVYEHPEQGIIVGNCHKVAQDQFRKRLLSVHELLEAWHRLKAELYTVNPSLKVVLTVSPVKHLRDGISENLISKSTLLLFSHQTEELYFPAYELISEDLRDYRFYEGDLAHPNELAINYVWEKFAPAFFSKEELQLNERIQKLVNKKNHRPLFPDSASSEAFVVKLEREMEEFFAETGIRL